MARFSCFTTLFRKKKSKESPKHINGKKISDNDYPRVKPEEFIWQPEQEKKLGSEEARVEVAAEVAYECSDEHDDDVRRSIRREPSDFGDGSHSRDSIGSGLQNGGEVLDDKVIIEKVIPSGHISDPGMDHKMNHSDYPKLKRSCSNIETKRRKTRSIRLPAKSHSHDDLKKLPDGLAKETAVDIEGSPLSVKTCCSADRVMLKKRSSRQVLPSRSQKLWWKLFMWSHRNIYNRWSSQKETLALMSHISNMEGGYNSDTVQACEAIDRKKKTVVDDDDSPNQWVAFCADSSPFSRVSAWVNSIEDCSLISNEDKYESDGEENSGLIAHLNSSEMTESFSGRNNCQAVRGVVDEVGRANSIIHSLNVLSSVAHISGMSLKVIPNIAVYNSLKAVDLSNNLIVQISAGSLPKSLHVLNLSKNRIATIEGLKELTKLRVLNLSYNRISRIGHGLSKCTAIREIYLAGNKISDVEGLHKLVKLTLIDLSFNKITTTKSLGQLVANYNSLRALNLLGNPIQSNIGDEYLRKAVTGLLPKVTYLNKQPIKQKSAREVATDSVAKAALGNGGWASRRRSGRNRSQSLGSAKSRGGEGSSHRGLIVSNGQKNSRQRSKSRQPR